jgi:hypothetical protein
MSTPNVHPYFPYGVRTYVEGWTLGTCFSLFLSKKEEGLTRLTTTTGCS